MNTTTDWDEFRRRLNEAKAALAGDAAPEDEAHILNQRARKLAGETAAETAPGDLIELVEFALGGEHYALELALVREVCALKDFTPVPCTPDFVVGVINLRGEIHTIIDLRRFFDLPESGITELNKVLVVEGEGLRLGILADAIHGVCTVSRAKVEAPPPTLNSQQADYLLGVTGDRLIVLDAARIIVDPRLIVDEQVRDTDPI